MLTRESTKSTTPKELVMRVLLVMALLIALFDLVALTPEVKLNFLQAAAEDLMDRSQNYIGSDFNYYIFAAHQNSKGNDPRSLSVSLENANMRWLYPPPILSLITAVGVHEYHKIILTGLIVLFLTMSTFIAARAVEGFGVAFGVANYHWKHVATLIVVLCWPVFFFNAISNLNVGTILLGLAAISVVPEKTKWGLYYIAAIMLAFIKPQYVILLFIRSLSEGKINSKDLIALAMVPTLHATAYFAWTDDYLTWIQQITSYALVSSNDGLWTLALLKSTNPVKILIGVMIVLTSLGLVFSIFTKKNFVVQVPGPVAGFCLLYFLAPRVYEYELYFLPVLVIYYLSVKRELVLLKFFAVGVMVLQAYRVISVASGENFYTPTLSQLVLLTSFGLFTLAILGPWRRNLKFSLRSP